MNEKGGTGKTTTAISVAAVLAERGLCVLVVDLDPQASAGRPKTACSKRETRSRGKCSRPSFARARAWARRLAMPRPGQLSPVVAVAEHTVQWAAMLVRKPAPLRMSTAPGISEACIASNETMTPTNTEFKMAVTTGVADNTCVSVPV